MIFSIYVDADSFSQKVKSFLLQFSKSKRIPIFFVANSNADSKKLFKDEKCEQSENIFFILCEKIKDAADDFIEKNAKPFDIVATRDILLAKRLIEKNICVINDRGTIFSRENIEDRILERNFYLNLSEIGFKKEKKSHYDQKDFLKFCIQFEKIATQKMLL